MSDAIDLDAYFTRIGYHEPSHEPTLETLTAIHLCHVETIPFENLDPFLRRPVRLDADSLQQKLIQGGRGGYCFEHNLLLNYVLKEIGFDVTTLAARVLWNAPDDSVRPRSHMLLLVRIAGTQYIADTGFGGLTLPSPLRLEADVEQFTSHEPFRLLHAEKDYLMQASFGGSWKSLYRFDLQRQFLADYEVSNWYLSNHPNSHFVTGLMAARTARDCRYALRNDKFSIHYPDGRTEQSKLSRASEVRTTLEEKFRINLADLADVDSALERLLATSSS